MKAKLSALKAITATAYKLAKLIYQMLSKKMPYKDSGQNYYEKQHKERLLKNLKRKAALLGFNLLPVEAIKNKELAMS